MPSVVVVAAAKPRSRKPEPRPYHHGDLRASLLATAARWLDERGAETLTLRELARVAGVSHAAPYHHFANRDALMAGVAEHAFDRLADALGAAAARWLDERGAETLTLRELARAAGVSHAAPYHHFESRDALMAGVAEHAFGRLADALAVAAEADDPAQALLDIGEAYVRQALAHPAQFRLMFGPTLARKAEHPGLQRAAERAFTVLLDAATRHAPERGLDLALAGWSLSHGVANLAIDGAFGGLPVAPAQARRLARLDAGALVRSMAAGLLQVPEAPAATTKRTKR